MAVATKVAAFCVFVRFFEVALGPAVDNWQPALAVLAAVSIVVGNIGALGQDSLKRLLGYSGIAQAGYMLVGLVAASELGVNALIFYLAAYALMNLAAFACDRRPRARDRARRRHRGGAGAGPRPPRAGLAADDLDAGAGRPAGDGRVHGQALPDRGGGGRRLHLARGGDRDRDDDLARLLPAGGRRRLDAARAGAAGPRARRRDAGDGGRLAGGRPAGRPAPPVRAGRAAGHPLPRDPGPRRGARRGDDLLRRLPLPAGRLGLERGAGAGGLHPLTSWKLPAAQARTRLQERRVRAEAARRTSPAGGRPGRSRPRSPERPRAAASAQTPRARPAARSRGRSREG